MDSDEFDARQGETFFECLERRPGLYCDSELGVVAAGRDRVEGVSVDSRGYPENRSLAYAPRYSQLREPPVFIDRVDCDQPDPELESGFEIFVFLEIPVQGHLVEGNAGLGNEAKLPK